MTLSPKLVACLVLLPPVIAVGLVKWRLAPRGLNATSFMTMPLVGLASSVLALTVQLALTPHGLKQRVADIAILSAIAAISEEVAKTLGLVWVLRRKRVTRTDTTSIVASGMLVGLGFSFAEAVVRTVESTSKNVSWLECVGRAMVSTPGHAAYTGLVAFMIARGARADVAVGLGLAVVAHFAFDAIGLAPQLADHVWLVEVACRSAQALLVWTLLQRIVRRSSPLASQAERTWEGVREHETGTGRSADLSA